LIFKRYHHQIEAAYDTAEFRQELDQIAQGNSRVVATLKEDTAASVWRSEYRSLPVLIKRYNTQGIWHAIRRSFRNSRADNCRNMARRFERAGIQTAENIAVIQEWFGPFKARSWFISELVQGEVLTRYFESQPSGSGQRVELEILKANVANLFILLRRHQLSHGDLKASNILLSDDQLYLIDLDAARVHKNANSFQRAHKKDQTRFLKNWLLQVEVHQLFEPLVNQSLP
jgi:tRNA A-37 threonylcarbamoyl transferase component Bud32